LYLLNEKELCDKCKIGFFSTRFILDVIPNMVCSHLCGYPFQAYLEFYLVSVLQTVVTAHWWFSTFFPSYKLEIYDNFFIFFCEDSKRFRYIRYRINFKTKKLCGFFDFLVFYLKFFQAIFHHLQIFFLVSPSITTYRLFCSWVCFNFTCNNHVTLKYRV
jgi:hypothetical protein